MVSARVDLGEFAKVRGLDAKHARALVAAVKGEAFRLKKATEAELLAGVGPATAPLTRGEQKTKTAAALSAFRRFVGYNVETVGGEIRAEIGVAAGVSRARWTGGKRRQLVSLLEGGGHTITRADQAAIARKLRRRLGQGFSKTLRRMGYGPRYAKRAAGAADLRLLIPRVGTRLVWPERQYAVNVVERERSATLRNVVALYDLAVGGKRWAREWWKTGEATSSSPAGLASMEAFFSGTLGVR